MLKEIVLSMVILSPTGIPAETPEVTLNPTVPESAEISGNHADMVIPSHSETAPKEEGPTLIFGYRGGREPQYYDSVWYYHDYTVIKVELNRNENFADSEPYFTYWGIDDYGNIECLGDDIPTYDLDEWAKPGTKVRFKWLHCQEFYESTDFEIIG